MGKEQPISFYDRAFKDDLNYHKHYSSASGYPLWQEIMKILNDKYKKSKILELGCGTGQFAEYLEENGYKDYIGVDFSGVAIDLARQFSNQTFFSYDMFQFMDTYEQDEDLIILLEVLEHIKNDIELLSKFEKGKTFIITVPKFDGTAHERHFKDAADFKRRYDSVLEYIQVIDFKHNVLAEGVRK